MPVQKCTLKNGKKGWKYGKSGKCYASKSAANRQGAAIKISQKRAGKSGRHS